MLFAGYHNNPVQVVDDLLDTLDDPALALVQWNEQYGIVQSRLPASLAAELEAIVGEFAVELDDPRRCRYTCFEYIPLNKYLITDTLLSTNAWRSANQYCIHTRS